MRMSISGGSVAVDRETRVIAGVAIITMGTTSTSANGVPPFAVDHETLRQVRDAINAAPEGIKGHVTHPNIEGIDGIRVLAGAWRSARIDGNRVVADFHVGRFAEHSPSGANLAEFLFSLAEEMPSHAGTSISASDIGFEGEGEGRALRLGTLDSVDWVGTPAANPAGMFSAGDPIKTAVQSAVATPATPAEGATAMKWTDAQLDWLKSHGLGPDATQADIDKLMETLSASDRHQFAALGVASDQPNGGGGGGSPQAGASTRPATAGTTITPGGHAAASASKDGTISLATLSELNEIAQLAGMPGEWATQMAIEQRTPAEARKIALATRRGSAGREPLSLGASAGQVRVGVDRAREGLEEAIIDAIQLRAGVRTLHRFDRSDVNLGGRIQLGRGNQPVEREPNERAQQFRHRRVLDMGREYLRILGVDQASQWSLPELATVLMSRSRLRNVLDRGGRSVFLSQATGDFPYILADAMGKSLRQAYQLAPATWRLWCRATTADDFKTQSRVQLSEAPALDTMSAGEEYTFGTLSEGRETYALTKYGKGLALTREALINDDLGAFDRIPAAMGRAARRQEEAAAYGILTANAVLSDSVALFATAHANLGTGAITTGNVGALRALIMKQTPLGGTAAQPLNIPPRYLIVPAALSVTAQSVVESTLAVQAASLTAAYETPSVIRNLVVIEQALLDAASSTQYYLACDPADIDTVDVCLLAGEEGPSVVEEENFETDTMRWKVRHHVVAKAIDYRGLARSSGT